MKISVVIITKNEEKNIARCLESVKWADEIVIIDSQSEDRTLEIASKYNTKTYSPPWTGYGPAKKEGVIKASNDWIFSIDADEEVTDKLKNEINSVLSNHDNKTFGYFVPRLTNFLGRWIKHSGWYPDYVLRLFNKQFGNFNDAVIHESVQLSGSTTYLKCDLLHYSYPDLDEYFRKFNLYTTVGAEELFKKGKKSGFVSICLRPIVAFIKQYIIKLGFLDGMEGFLVCYFSAKAVMVKYAKLRTMNKRAES
jgi:glycosyltransferase involved in cell wall biosynthesis